MKKGADIWRLFCLLSGRINSPSGKCSVQTAAKLTSARCIADSATFRGRRSRCRLPDTRTVRAAGTGRQSTRCHEHYDAEQPAHRCARDAVLLRPTSVQASHPEQAEIAGQAVLRAAGHMRLAVACLIALVAAHQQMAKRASDLTAQAVLTGLIAEWACHWHRLAACRAVPAAIRRHPAVPAYPARLPALADPVAANLHHSVPACLKAWRPLPVCSRQICPYPTDTSPYPPRR